MSLGPGSGLGRYPPPRLSTCIAGQTLDPRSPAPADCQPAPDFAAYLSVFVAAEDETTLVTLVALYRRGDPESPRLVAQATPFLFPTISSFCEERRYLNPG